MTKLPQEIIRTKRDGSPLDPEDIVSFVAGLTDGSISEGQVAALAMAVYFRGMARDEAVALTLAMRDSGDVLSWAELDQPVADKHSTGGVGDNVSLMLAPIVAACGIAVPMISGRGLGHTGGTLDKMDSIPGYQTMPSTELFRQTVRNVGCAIIGQTGNLAPADKRFYGIRDVTATVESVPLITASILSKKLAAGLGALVLDVKCGNGAFMDNAEKATELARSLVEVANGAGLPTTALITEMNQPLASAAGNAVEVINAVEFLRNDRQDPHLLEVTMALAREMVISSGIAADEAEARIMTERVLRSGAAAEHFGRMVKELGGPADFVNNYHTHCKSAPVVVPVSAETQGYIRQINTRAVGLCVVELGGGRRVASDSVDHAVGLTELAPLGTRMDVGDPICLVHARTKDDANRAEKLIRNAFQFSDSAGEQPVSILDRIA